MPITPELLDQILKDYQKPEDLIGDLPLPFAPPITISSRLFL